MASLSKSVVNAFVYHSCLFSRRHLGQARTNPFTPLSRGITSYSTQRWKRHSSLFHTRCALGSSSSEKALPVAVDELVDEYLKAGMNVYIADGEKGMLESLFNALEMKDQVNGLIDVVFTAGSPQISEEIKRRNLQTNLSVNYKKGIDIFLALVNEVDGDCNGVLDSNHFEADRYAAEIANQVILLIQENDFKKTENGLQSFPVRLAPAMTEIAAKSLCSSGMFIAGIRGATVREGSSIADVSLSSHVMPRFLEMELRRLPCVCGIGLLPSSEKTTVVVAANNLAPFDITAPVHTMRNLPTEKRNSELSDEERAKSMESLPKWRIISGRQDALARQFVFPNADRADSFVRYAQFVSGSMWHHPEIRQSYTQVRICLTTHDAGGITALDTMFATELSRVFERMTNVSGP